MAIALAVSAALAYGAADFFGGSAARRLPAMVAVVIAQAAGLVLLLAALPIAGSASAADLAWGAAAGLAGGIGVPLLYAGLATGPMSVVAPLTALTSAGVPVMVGVLLGDRSAALAWLGVALALVAAAAVSSGTGTGQPSRIAARGVLLALAAGAGFGVFFVLLDRADPASGLWPLLAARCVGLGIALLAVAAVGWVQPSRSSLRLAMLAGALDAVANVGYLLAVQRGYLSIVGAVVALYPAMTVLLARLANGERTSHLQRAGLALAAGAIVMISLG